MRPTQWRAIPFDAVPPEVRFIVPREGQGQTIEVAYGTFGASEESPRTAQFKRVEDRSDDQGPIYYQRVRRPTLTRGNG